MLKILWTEGRGWSAPSIEPCALYLRWLSGPTVDATIDAPLSILPSATVLHYAQSIFEGLKAYSHPDGKVTMFRPDMNMKRMNVSAARLALPVSLSVFLRRVCAGMCSLQTFNGDGFLECIRQLVALDRHWIPNEPGHSLYIRPTMSEQIKWCIFASID